MSFLHPLLRFGGTFSTSQLIQITGWTHRWVLCWVPWSAFVLHLGHLKSTNPGMFPPARMWMPGFCCWCFYGLYCSYGKSPEMHKHSILGECLKFHLFTSHQTSKSKLNGMIFLVGGIPTKTLICHWKTWLGLWSKVYRDAGRWKIAQFRQSNMATCQRNICISAIWRYDFLLNMGTLHGALLAYQRVVGRIYPNDWCFYWNDLINKPCSVVIFKLGVSMLWAATKQMKLIFHLEWKANWFWYASQVPEN